MNKTFAFSVLVAAACTLSACGRAGPTAAQADAALHRALAAHERLMVRAVGASEAAAAMQMVSPHISRFTVSAIRCARGVGGVYSCATTVSRRRGSRTTSVKFVRVHGVWTLVSHANG